jgi:tryptophan synthase beta subunit
LPLVVFQSIAPPTNLEGFAHFYPEWEVLTRVGVKAGGKGIAGQAHAAIIVAGNFLEWPEKWGQHEVLGASRRTLLFSQATHVTIHCYQIEASGGGD